MKKILIAILMVTCFAACKHSTQLTAVQKESVQKSALDLCHQFMNLYQEMKFDECFALFTDTGTGYSNNNFQWVSDMKKWVDENKGKIKKMSYTADTIIVDVLDQNCAITTFRYFYSVTDTGSNVSYASGIASFTMNKPEKDWKIIAFSEYADWTPLLLPASLEKDRSQMQVDLNQKFTSLVYQFNAVAAANISLQKKAGKSPYDLGLATGKIFAPTWDKNSGFEGMKKGMIYNMQLLSSQAEILELSGEHLKIRVLKDFKAWMPEKVTDKDMLDYYRGVMQPIGDYLGGKTDITDDGNYYIITLTKK